MTPKQIQGYTISEKAVLAEEKFNDAMLILEDLIYEADPQTEEGKDTIAQINDFFTILDRAYSRVSPYLNELQGV